MGGGGEREKEGARIAAARRHKELVESGKVTRWLGGKGAHLRIVGGLKRRLKLAGRTAAAAADAAGERTTETGANATGNGGCGAKDANC